MRRFLKRAPQKRDFDIGLLKERNVPRPRNGSLREARSQRVRFRCSRQEQVRRPYRCRDGAHRVLDLAGPSPRRVFMRYRPVGASPKNDMMAAGAGESWGNPLVLTCCRRLSRRSRGIASGGKIYADSSCPSRAHGNSGPITGAIVCGSGRAPLISPPADLPLSRARWRPAQSHPLRRNGVRQPNCRQKLATIREKGDG